MGGSLVHLLDYVGGTKGKLLEIYIHTYMYIYVCMYIFKQYLHENWPVFFFRRAAIKMSAVI